MRKKSVLHPFRHLAILIVAAGLLTGSCGCFYETSEEVIYPATAPNVSVSRESESSTHRTETATPKTAETEEKKTTEEQSAESRCRKLLAQMTMEDQVAQLLMPEIRKWDVGDGQGEQPVTVLPEAVASLLSAYDFGGVILFAENCRDTGQLVTLTDALQQAGAAKQGIGLWIATDQEGGSVTRLSQGTQLIGNMALGAIGSEEAAEQAGEITGRELSALGIGLDLAPVLDVNSNPANPV
ncbi:MAG: hypothetical protein IJT34_02755, partial [Butyrivibrio sp.]|nr:hypothetical protein [Butyrivibrio sp.]